jgi:hypothetical protein
MFSMRRAGVDGRWKGLTWNRTLVRRNEQVVAAYTPTGPLLHAQRPRRRDAELFR